MEEQRRGIELEGQIAEFADDQQVGTIVLEQDDERTVQRSRYMKLESIAPIGEDQTVDLPTLLA